MAQERVAMRKIGIVLLLKSLYELRNRSVARSCSIALTAWMSTCGQQSRRVSVGPLLVELDEAALFLRLFPKPLDPGSRQIPRLDWSWLAWIGSATKPTASWSPAPASVLTAPRGRWLLNRRRPSEHVLFAIRR